MIINVFLCKKPSEYQTNLVIYLKSIKHIKFNLYWFPLFMYDSQLPPESEYTIWNKDLASKNLDTVKKMNSIVALEKQTLLTQKVSDNNPITENMAINHDFKITYISDDIDVTNLEYSLVISEHEYLINLKTLKNR